jgi:ABC-type polysaccharide/polyol phosphate transport system ATPase subunit
MMAGFPIVELQHVWKTFHRHPGRLLLRSHLRHLFSARTPAQPFYALKDISFRVEPGESLAIVGGNGAGKSTLLSIIAGLAPPDRGTLSVNGRVAALLELGSGFHPDLTGAENVTLNAALLGLSRDETRRAYGGIVEFAELADFMDEPLRTYSAGMTMRLAFAVAVNTNPDLLLVDELLAVGDQAFQTKCIEKVREFRRQGKTMICVSHSAATVQELCDRAIWLDHGDLLLDGLALEVTEAYEGRLRSGATPS